MIDTFVFAVSIIQLPFIKGARYGLTCPIVIKKINQSMNMIKTIFRIK